MAFVSGFAIVQEVTAPFVLGGLGCNGSEARLVDCPASEDDLNLDINPYFSYYEYYTPAGAGQCETVFVACGTETDASMPFPQFRPACSIRLLEV